MMPMDDTMASRFNESATNHPPTQHQIDAIERLRGDAKYLAFILDELCPDSREKSLAFTHLEDAVMWAVKSIVLPRNQRNTPGKQATDYVKGQEAG